MYLIRNPIRSILLQDAASGFAARIIPGLFSIATIPVLVRYLGPERYGAIGIFLTIQMLSGLLEIGFTTGVARQAAWLTGNNAAADKFSSLLRSFEIPYLVIAVLIAVGGILFGEGILSGAFRLRPQTIDLGDLGVGFIFACVAARFPFALYTGYLSGRGQIRKANLILLITELLRIIGAVVVVVCIGPMLSVFFGWQFLVALVATTAAYVESWRMTPARNGRVAPDWRTMLEIRGMIFSAGQMTVLFIIANSLDKLLLPWFISAADYGRYVAVSQLSISLYLILQPAWAAAHPRMISLFAVNDVSSARTMFIAVAGAMTAIWCAFMLAVSIAYPSILVLWLGFAGAGYGVVLIALCAGYGLCALSHFALSVHQAASAIFPKSIDLLCCNRLRSRHRVSVAGPDQCGFCSCYLVGGVCYSFS